MTKKNNYTFPPQAELVRIRKKLSDPKYEGGNVALPKEVDLIEKMKYSVRQSILSYHQENKKSLATMVKEIGIASITEKKLYDICRGKTTDFSLGELVIYANNLGITIIPCLDCGRNVFPVLLETVILSLKEQGNLIFENFHLFQTLGQHQALVH